MVTVNLKTERVIRRLAATVNALDRWSIQNFGAPLPRGFLAKSKELTRLMEHAMRVPHPDV